MDIVVNSTVPLFVGILYSFKVRIMIKGLHNSEENKNTIITH